MTYAYMYFAFIVDDVHQSGTKEPKSSAEKRSRKERTEAYVEEQAVHNNVLYGEHRGETNMNKYLIKWQTDFDQVSGNNENRVIQFAGGSICSSALIAFELAGCFC